MQGRQPPSLAVDCPLPAACAGVNAVRPVEAAALHATMQHGANVIQHNAGDYAHSRRVAMMANPIRCARLGFAQSALCPAPPRSAPWSVQRKASLCCWQWCRSVAPQSPPSLAAPVPFCGGVIVGQPVVRGCRPGGLRLKDFMPARRRLAAAARAAQKGRASLVPASPASAARPGPAWSYKGKPRSGSGATERRSVACGLSAARTRRPRAVAPPCRRWRPGGPPSRGAGNGLSGKRNDRSVAVVIW